VFVRGRGALGKRVAKTIARPRRRFARRGWGFCSMAGAPRQLAFRLGRIMQDCAMWGAATKSAEQRQFANLEMELILLV
jgi:hypothetical protein